MIDRIGKLSSLLKRVKRAKDSWMDLLPLSAMTEQQRENQYQADMTQLNNERQGRSEAALDPSQHKRPRTLGLPHIWLSTKGFFHSAIT